MRPLLFLVAMLLAFSCLASKEQPLDLSTAIAEKAIAIKSTSKGGLGPSNLIITIKNQRKDSTFIRIPPGLHFKSVKAGYQDLLTVQEVLIALAPLSRQTVDLRGFCMQASMYSPARQGGYNLNGFAVPELLGLANLLYDQDRLLTNYGQMFIWAITDKRQLYDVYVQASEKDAASKIMRYVTGITGQEPVKIEIEETATPQPKLELFSKKTALAFHNPVEQVATFRMYDADGNIMHTFYENKKLNRGIRVHEFGMNDMVLAGSQPVYYFKVTSSTGKVLAEKKVDSSTQEINIEPEVLQFRFMYQLEAPVKKARLSIYLQDGTLLEQFKDYNNLQPGHYAIDMKFLHLYPASTRFVAKMESTDGSVLKEQILSQVK